MGVSSGAALTASNRTRIRRRSGKKGLNGLAPDAIHVAIDKAVQFRFAHRGAASVHDFLI